ncbi:MAG: cache domain-containing protein, partial [Alphaproteobacteria bacterium]|nr:cache domain-containing protein [Alphaproteobacteria bacterium]
MVQKTLWERTLEHIRTIKFGIVFYNVFILIFSVSFVILYSQKNNDEMIISNLQSFMELSNKNIKERIYEEFEKIGRLLSTNVKLLHNVRDTTEPPVLIDDLFYSILHSSQYVSSVYYAKKNNYFSMAMPRTSENRYKANPNKKLPSDTALGWSLIYNAQLASDNDNATSTPVATQPNSQIEHWYYFDHNRKLLDTEVIHNNTFMATSRPWYALAEFSITPKWTDAYLFQLSRVPGITAAVGIIDEQKNSHGVFAIDLSLDKLNALLSSLKMIKSSKMYIIDFSGNIIASTEKLRLQETQNQQFRLPSLNDPELHEIKNIIQQKPAGVKSFLAEFGGRRYVILNGNFEYGNLNWRLININSVDDILSPNIQKRQMTIGLSFLLLMISAGIMY